MRRLLLLPLVYVFLACQSAPQPAPDFSFTLEPFTLEMNLGESKTFRYSLKTTGNLPSRPVLSVEQADGSPLPAGLLVNTAENPETVGVRVEEPLEAKTYKLRLKGTVGSLVRTANLELKVGDPSFTLSLDPTTIDLEQGTGGQAGKNVFLSLQPDQNFASTLANAELQARQANGSPLPSGLYFLRSNTDDNNRLRLSWFANTSVTPGNYNIQLQVTSRNKVRSVNLQIAVQRLPDFSLSLTRSNNFSTQQGGSFSTQINITRASGFSGPISFTARGYATGAVLVPGIQATFTQNPTTSNSVSMNLMVNETVAACFGTCRYGVLIEAVAGAVRKELELELWVSPRADFSMVVTTNNTFIEQLRNDHFFPLDIRRSQLFSDPIALQFDLANGNPLPQGLTITPRENPVTRDSTSLNIIATREVPAGTYTIRVRGTAGSLVRTTEFPLEVRLAPDFTLTAAPNTFAAERSRSYESLITIDRNASQALMYSPELVLEREDGSALPAGLTHYWIYPNGNNYDWGDTDGVSRIRLIMRLTEGVSLGELRLRVRATLNRQPYYTLEPTVPITFSVNQPSAGTAVQATATYGSEQPFLIWAAFQDGDGVWQAFDGWSNSTLRFRVTDSAGRYGVALLCVGQVVIYQLTFAEAANPSLRCNIAQPNASANLADVGQMTSIVRTPTPYLRPTITWASGNWQYSIATVSQTGGQMFASATHVAVVSNGWLQGRNTYTFPAFSETAGWRETWAPRSSSEATTGSYTLSRVNTNRSASSAFIYLMQGLSALPSAEQINFTINQPTASSSWTP